MSGFRKDDSAKLRFDLIDHRFERELAAVLTHGSRKYADNNWQLANPAEARARYRAAMRRHYDRWLDGEEIDADSGCPHLACMTACLMFLRWFERESAVPAAFVDPTAVDVTHSSWRVPITVQRLGDDAIEGWK